MIYLDNAATSWPKPPVVLKAMADALEKAGFNQSQAAKLLGLNERMLRYKLKKYGLK